MTWWIWLLLGLLLLGAELLTPGGFFILFFGVGAIVVGALAGAGVLERAWMQWLLFSLISIVSLLLFRNPLLRRLRLHEKPAREIDTMVGEVAVPLGDIAQGEIGKVELRGAAWSAKNDGPAPLRRGQRARVERVDGLMLWVRAE